MFCFTGSSIVDGLKISVFGKGRREKVRPASAFFLAYFRGTSETIGPEWGIVN